MTKSFQFRLFIILGFITSFYSLTAETAEKFYSEKNQDQYILTNFFPTQKGSEYLIVDIGAFDGETQSNSKAIAEQRHWRCICIEPTPQSYAKLIKNRKNCICIQGCIDDTEGVKKFLRVIGGEMLNALMDSYDLRHLTNVLNLANHCGFKTEILEVPCFTFNKIMSDYNVSHIDVLSIDIEGGELKILKSIDWNRITIDVICVEEIFKDLGTREFLESKGFVHIIEIFPDVIYRNKKYLNKE